MTGVALGDGAYTAALVGGTQILNTVGLTVGDANFIKLLMLGFAISVALGLVWYIVKSLKGRR